MAEARDENFLSGRNVTVPEQYYAADWPLYNSFIGFSAEILRVSLAGIGVSGFLFALIADRGHETLGAALDSSTFQTSILSALGFLALAAVLALAYRFYASDGMYHHLLAIKLLIVAEEDERQAKPDEAAANRMLTLRAKIGREETDREKKLRRSEKLLQGACISLALGAVALGFAFAAILILH